MTPGAVFSIASLTKQFTAVAVLQLVQHGRVALQDTLGRFLPGLPRAFHPVTIEQLLSHTAGIPNPQKTAGLLALGRGWLTAAQVISAIGVDTLAFRPGTRWEYSNAGYQLLGAVVERVTAQPFPEYMEATLLGPAGMTTALWGDDTRVVAGRASSYLESKGRFENAVNANVQIAWAAGAIQASAPDLFRWHRALVGGRLLHDSLLRRAWQPAHLGSGAPTDYGFGWFVGSLVGHRLVEHGGNMGGFTGHMMFFPDDDLLVIALLNVRGRRLPELVAGDIAAHMLGQAPDYTPQVIPARELAGMTGTYRSERGDTIDIEGRGGELTYQRRGGARFVMTKLRTGDFLFQGTAVIARPIVDQSGSVIALETMTQRGQSRTHLSKVGRR